MFDFAHSFVNQINNKWGWDKTHGKNYANCMQEAHTNQASEKNRIRISKSELESGPESESKSGSGSESGPELEPEPEPEPESESKRF